MALFHIGYHKTATTYIQRFLFEAHPEVFHRVPQRAIHDALILPGPLTFDAGQGAQFVKGEIDKASDQGRLAVFSNERLSGSFNSGGHDVLDIMRRIGDCDDDPKILLVIREQRSMIRSLYSQYVRAYGCCSLEEFLAGDYTPHCKELFRPDLLEYHRLIAAYQEHFGRKRVSVLPYEWLKSRENEFLDTILEAAGIDHSSRTSLSFRKADRVNTASTPLQISVKRRLNPLYTSHCPHIGSTYQYRPIQWLARAAISASGRLRLKRLNLRIANRRDRLIDHVATGRYERSNRITAKLTGIDLAVLGYL